MITKTSLLLLSITLFAVQADAQVGVGTTTPNSTLDIRGSLSAGYRAFSANTSAAITDHALVFTATAAASLTLPDAATCTGRIYWVKNTSSNASVLTIGTTGAQTIDGLSSWTLTQTNKAVGLVSNGANWLISSESLPGASAGTAWIYGGNNVTSLQKIGTTSNFDFPFITNNTEKMRLTTAGSLGIGTTTFNATYPERLLVDAGASGNTNYQNVIVGKGNTNSYAQLNIQNSNAGTGASSDVVATADNGNETTNFIDMGINSSANTSTVMGDANDAYLYNVGQDLLIGTGTSGKSLLFLTSGTSQASNERMRVDGNGNVGINTSAPELLFHVVKNTGSGPTRSDMALLETRNTNTAATSNFPVLNLVRQIPTGLYAANTNAFGGLINFGFRNPGGAFQDISQIQGFSLNSASRISFYSKTGMTNGDAATGTMAENMVLEGKSLYVGTPTASVIPFDATNQEKLLVDAGTTSSVNVISGKGTLNNYLQLNIQNKSNGNAASSDVVATADNGSETTNYIDMGINGSGNASGVFGAANDAYLYNVGQNLLMGTSTAGKSMVFMTGGSSQASNERMRIDGNGNVGIGCIAPNYKLQVVGDIAAQGGTIRAASAIISTTLTACSDIRFKEHIKPLGNTLENILKLQGVSYDWKVKEFPDRYFNNKKQIGIIAQDLEKVYPELVETDKDGYKSVDYSKMAPLFIESIKEQQQQISLQQQQIDLLKKEIALLKEKIK